MPTADAIDYANTGGSRVNGPRNRYTAAKADYKKKKEDFLRLWNNFPSQYKFAVSSVRPSPNKRSVYYELTSVSDWNVYRALDKRAFLAWGFPEGNVYNAYFPVSGDSAAGSNQYVVAGNTIGGTKTITNLSTKVKIAMTADGYGAGGQPGTKLVAAWKARQAAKTAYEKAKAEWKKVKPPVKPPTTTTTKPKDTTDDSSATNLYAYNDTKLKYNLGAVNYQYFRNYDSTPFLNSEERGVQHFPGGNAPVSRLKNAQEAFSGKHLESAQVTKNGKTSTVWKYVDDSPERTHKGIIQSMIKANKIQSNTSGGTALSPEQANKAGKELNAYRMGFQFHYNPTNLNVTWQGSPNVDIGMVMSGEDKFGPIGASSGTGSGFSVTIPLNRMADQQYVGMPEADWSNISWEKLYGLQVKEQNQTEKLNQSPTFDDLRKIRDLGTMYDVEFLLQTVLGYKLKSAIRLGKHQMTADLGYLGGFPVEIHLGKNMRYYVSVSSISVYHSVFTKDMVPILSSLTISCSRIPDYTPTAYGR